MELFHNTFLDYVAASTMKTSYLDLDYEGAAIELKNMKKHNPSALLVDGYSPFDLESFDPNDPYHPETLLYPYKADHHECGGRHAQIILRGDSRLYLRSGVKANGDCDVGSSLRDPANGLGGYVWPYGVMDRRYSFTINSGSADGLYDGSFMKGEGAGNRLKMATLGEGNNVLDIEGKLTIRSTSDENQTDEAGFVVHRKNRKYLNPTGCHARHRPCVPTVPARGMLNVPPIKIDYMGQEIKDDMINRVSRPLVVNAKYPCYNSSSIFLNNEISMHNINWHHNDLLKIATPEPDKSEPALVGGEKATYDYAYWSTVPASKARLFVENPLEDINTKVPLVSMFTTTLHCHESIVASGARFVVTDKFWYDPFEAEGHAKLVPNVSTFMCYHHGDQLDMLRRGYGRTIMLGSQQNKMADGVVLNDFVQNAYINVYRTWHTNGNAQTWATSNYQTWNRAGQVTTWAPGNYLVRLSLETDAQPMYTAGYALRGQDNFSKLVDAELNKYKRVASQVLYLGNGSFSSVGWTTTMADQVIRRLDLDPLSFGSNYSYSFGINEGHRPRPWDAAWMLSQRKNVAGTVVHPPADFIYSLNRETNNPAEFYVNGDNYYFGGRDASGNVATEPTVASNESCVFYTNHGGKTLINQKDISVDQGHYFDCFVDTIFAYRQWPRVKNARLDAFADDLSGIVDLPHDQVKFARSIQPYALDFRKMLMADDGEEKERNVRLSVYNEADYGVSPVMRNKASGEEVTIGWNFRTDKSVGIGPMEVSPTFTPVKSLPSFMSNEIQDEIFKITTPASAVMPAVMPEAVLTVSTGDVISQLRVSGATKADPFHLYVTGGHQGYGIVREFASLDSTYFNPGEGCHAAIFIDGTGHIGLGSRGFNKHSSNAWSVLGYDYVTLYPNGNAFVWVNSDLLIADRLPIIPTENFGSYGSDKHVATFNDEDQRITFYSEQPREIRIPEGGELDLSAFGKNNPDPNSTMVSSFPQQIEFAGKVKLILEAGASIRFPSDPDFQPVMYFNDEAELIFEGAEDRDEEIWDDYTGSAAVRSRIYGKGQIWLNKNSKLKIFDTALVGVETDETSPSTDVTISIQRESEMQLGNENVAGGAFQVGNPVNRPGHEISFTLATRSSKSRFLIHREGFFGLGAGVINKAGVPNERWRMHGLYNVENVAINFFESQGIFDHSQIFDGSNRRSSIMAVGPATQYSIDVGTNTTTGIIRGGGNIIRIVNSGDQIPSTGGTDGNGKPPHEVEIIGSTPVLEGDTTGDYNILASTVSIRQVAQENLASGTGTVTTGESYVGDASGFYSFIGHQITSVLPATYVAFSETEGAQSIAYVSSDGEGATGTLGITRTGAFSIADASNPEGSLNTGALRTGIDPNGVPAGGYGRSYT